MTRDRLEEKALAWLSGWGLVESARSRWASLPPPLPTSAVVNLAALMGEVWDECERESLEAEEARNLKDRALADERDGRVLRLCEAVERLLRRQGGGRP